MRLDGGLENLALGFAAHLLGDHIGLGDIELVNLSHHAG